MNKGGGGGYWGAVFIFHPTTSPLFVTREEEKKGLSNGFFRAKLQGRAHDQLLPVPPPPFS
jgi:hypothetical protein